MSLYMEPLTTIGKTILTSLKRDMRVRLGVGAGASVLLSAGVLGLGGSIVPDFANGQAIIPQERIQPSELEVVDFSTTTVSQIVESLKPAERFNLMLYNSGAGDTLKHRGDYTVFVPASSRFDYLPKGYIASLSRAQMSQLSLGHIVSRALPMDESLNGTVITMGGTFVQFSVDTESNAISIGNAKVIKAYKAKNGWVYIVDKVLAETN